MNRWIRCAAEGRDHVESDFTSRAVYDKSNKIIGHQTRCRWCDKQVRELIKK